MIRHGIFYTTQTQTRTAKGLLIRGLASTFIDFSGWIDPEGGCPQELMLYIEQELVDQKGKILLGRGTRFMLETLAFTSMFVPYEPKYRIARKIYEARINQFTLDSETGRSGQSNREIVAQYVQEAKVMAARIINKGNFVYNIPAMPPLLVSMIKQEKDDEIFLQLEIAIDETLTWRNFGGPALSALFTRSQITLQNSAAYSSDSHRAEHMILRLIGKHAARLGQKDAARQHLQSIVNKGGVFPLTQGVEILEKSLVLAAQHALVDLE